MSKRTPSNVSTSIRDRLLNHSRAKGEDYNLLLVRYAAERFLYRLGRSEHRDRFVLKGAMLFVLWEGDPHRMTRDLDFLSYGASEVDQVVKAIQEICSVDVEEDGIAFNSEAVKGERIREDRSHEGVRIRVFATLGSARIPLQIDIAFGDAVTPDAEESELPTILGSLAPNLKAYPRDTVVAEKVQAMVLLGFANTRMKDFYDIAYLARHFNFDGQDLSNALKATFTRRGSNLPDGLPLALTDEFANDTVKQRQWSAFLQKSGLDDGFQPDLPSVVEEIKRFVVHPVEAALKDTFFDFVWLAPGPWMSESE